MNNIFGSKKVKLKLIILGIIALVAVSVFLNYLFYQTKIKTKATGSPTVSLSFDPASANAATFSTSIKAVSVDIAATNITGYGFHVTFDKTKVQVSSLAYNFGTVATGLGDDGSTANLPDINSRGYINIRGQIQTAGGLPITSSTPTSIVMIGFSAASATNPTTVVVDSNGAFFNSIDSAGTITGLLSSGSNSVSVFGAVASPTPTPTPVPSGNVTLNLKLKFQGIVAKPPDAYNKMKVQIIAVSSTGVKSSPGSGDFTSDGNGTWSGSIGIGVTSPGAGFKLLVKGPKHIRKKVCDTTPTESSPGTYHCSQGTITLAAGANTLDLSGILELTGDLPVQDGLVNSYDLSLIRNNLGKTDADTLALADVNLDGKIDTQDWSLLISALSTRGDEE